MWKGTLLALEVTFLSVASPCSYVNLHFQQLSQFSLTNQARSKRDTECTDRNVTGQANNVSSM